MPYGIHLPRLAASTRGWRRPHAGSLAYVVGLVVFTSAVSGCGSTVATSTGPSPVKCSVTLTPPASPVNSGGATATVGVTTQPECAWNASSEAGWITGLTPASGQGSAQLEIHVVANPAASTRQGDIVVNDVHARITQDAAPCQYDLSSTRQVVPSSGGSGSITVSATAGCAWSARTDETWIAITAGATGTGSGTVSFTAAPNPGGSRSASLVIAGQSVTISQDTVEPPPPNCSSYTVSPRTISVSAAVTEGLSVSVTANAGCEWTASSNTAWISVTGRTSGSGAGTVTFSVASNSGASRTGTLTIAGQTVTITQAAASATCPYSVNPTTVSIGASGGAVGTFAVTVANGCAWTATSGASWLSITSGAAGTGNGSVAVNAAANTGSARTGTLTIANLTVTVNQAAAPCSYSVSPTNVSITAAGGTGTPVSVTTSSACTWTATSNASWLTILTGSSGTGNGTVTYSVQPNTGGARSGSLTVAGQTVTISQSAACTYTISPTSKTLDKSGGTGGPVSVTTQSGCAWTAVSNASWITVTSGSSGTGNGTVMFTVAQNTTGSNRTGTLTIAGRTFTVTQNK